MRPLVRVVTVTQSCLRTGGIRTTTTTTVTPPPSAEAIANETVTGSFSGRLLATASDVAGAAAAVAHERPAASKLVWFYRHGESKANVVSKAAREEDGLSMSDEKYPG